MSFFESPRFPDDISYGASGGPCYSTDVVVINSGFEQANINWSVPRARYDVAHGVRTQAQLDVLLAFFRICKGRAHGFRYKDWSDFTVAVADGRMGTTAVGTGLPTYQLCKRYSNAAGSEDRAVKKPVSGSVTCYRNAVQITVGAGAGNITIDTATGIVTFVADASAAASSITAGATTQVVLPANLGLVGGKLLYLSGFAGSDAALVNGLAHTINSITGAGPYTFTLATNTSGKTITLGSGAGAKFPQASDALTWAGEFDVPVRFDTDEMRVSIDSYNIYSWGQIPLVEKRIS